MRVERRLLAAVNRYPINGQIIITSSALGKRGSNSSAGCAQSGSKRLRKTGDDGPLAALAELKRAWVDSQAAPVPPDALEYGSEDESEGENASG
ncbi:hypothetical protein EYR40_004722 [Pleurotus pulmonarius]|nr:hypothetical protein EYR36_004124 [Pleurotus pulmonarius]KAF4605930.1 hypothetical protein EYR40_004722 [Pleurotus pulmonarius]